MVHESLAHRLDPEAFGSGVLPISARVRPEPGPPRTAFREAVILPLNHSVVAEREAEEAAVSIDDVDALLRTPVVLAEGQHSSDAYIEAVNTIEKMILTFLAQQEEINLQQTPYKRLCYEKPDVAARLYEDDPDCICFAAHTIDTKTKLPVHNGRFVVYKKVSPDTSAEKNGRSGNLAWRDLNGAKSVFRSRFDRTMGRKT